MLDELLEVFERDRRGGHEGTRPKGLRARLARLFGGGDHEPEDEDRRERRDHNRRERDDRFDWGDD